MQFMVQGAWGVIPAHLNELAPADARGAFPGYAYQVGNLLASGNAVWQAQIAEARHNDYGLALALVAGRAAVAIAVVDHLRPGAARPLAVRRGLAPGAFAVGIGGVDAQDLELLGEEAQLLEGGASAGPRAGRRPRRRRRSR